jgi:hypothetical protein
MPAQVQHGGIGGATARHPVRRLNAFGPNPGRAIAMQAYHRGAGRRSSESGETGQPWENEMLRKLQTRKRTALAVSMLFAGAAIVAGPAGARGPLPPDPACVAQVQNDCSTNWQVRGYLNYDDCVADRTCTVCNVYLCGGIYYATGTPDLGKPE